MRPRAWPARRREGLALVAVLAILVLLLAMAGGAVHLALGDARRGASARQAVVARAAADAGAWGLVDRTLAWDYDAMPVGDTIPSAWWPAGDGGVAVRGERLSPLAWWITATGFAPDSASPGHARREVNLVLRQALPQLATAAVLTAPDSVTVSGTGAVVGADTVTGAWGAGCVPGSASAGIAVPDTARVRRGAVSGSPALLADPAAALASTYLAFGPVSWAALGTRARHVLPAGSVVTPGPRLTSGACDASQPANWGEPSGIGPCARYVPILWVRGDLEVRGGRGQGVLLVDGDVRFSMGAEFHGLVVARDDVEAGPGGGVVYGAVLAADSVRAPGDHSRIDGGLVLRRATCTLAGVARRVAPLVPVGRRAWAPMW